MPPPLGNTVPAFSDNCPGAVINANNSGSFDVPLASTALSTTFSYAGVTINPKRDGWISYTATPGQRFTIRYTNTTQNASLGVYRNNGSCPGTLIALRNSVSGLGTEEITINDNGTGATYYIRIMNETATGDMLGTFSLTYQNAAVMVYDGGPIASPNCTPANLDTNRLQCAVVPANGNISLGINADPQRVYYIRVIDLHSSANMQGHICVFNGPPQPGDLCSEAQEVSIGTCDYPYEIYSSFFNNEGLPDPSCFDPADSIYRDGWIKFQVSNPNQKLAVEYNDTTNNYQPALAVYQGTCSNLQAISCSKASSGNGKTVLEFSPPGVGTYFVRIMNLTANNTMTGKLCVYPVVARDTCAQAIQVNLGDCGLKFDLLESFGLDPGDQDPSCTVDVLLRDAWFRFDPTDTVNVQIEFSPIQRGELLTFSRKWWCMRVSRVTVGALSLPRKFWGLA